MSNDKNEVQFHRLQLKENDYLIIKANVKGARDIFKDIRNSDFVKFLTEEKQVKVFICGSDLNFQILRMEDSDKLIVEVDTSEIQEEFVEEHLKTVYSQVTKSIDKDKLVIITNKGNINLKVEKGVKNESKTD